jgi:phospholipase/carboxylesterase
MRPSARKRRSPEKTISFFGFYGLRGKQLVAEYLDAIQQETGPDPHYCVIWLHGLGADGGDFAPIVPELGLPASPAIRFLFPHAPLRPVTINNGYVMRAWYDILGTDLARREDEQGVRASQAMVEALMARENARGIPTSNIVLAGFSQGGAIALQTGLRHPAHLAGIMALSTYLPVAQSVATERAAANQDVPIFMAHGVQDPMIALPRATASRDALGQLGYKVEWHEYPMPHAVCPEEIRDIGNWLRKVLGLSAG